jgi:Bacterial regulatory proteins, luxR family
LIIIDLDMPDMKWEEGLSQLKSKAPDSRFVVISASEDSRNIKKALELGISGYLPKRAETKMLTSALKLILDGGTYLPPSILEHANSGLFGDQSRDGKGKGKTLTPRQSEVLSYVAEGMSNKQIAYKNGRFRSDRKNCTLMRCCVRSVPPIVPRPLL